ncbi:hypothetical protein WISP_148764 [Willisornis vidua]|uniref:Uncharacterized protein n=1 Tax=Willisornis vidua TaxID=1566151 RepID=A0ABQ9CK44_9PASS|nr:hypothetical protein WISP_148764 [Willisornis vidua]
MWTTKEVKNWLDIWTSVEVMGVKDLLKVLWLGKRWNCQNPNKILETCDQEGDYLALKGNSVYDGVVTTLVNTSNKGPSGKKKGRSKKAHVLAASVEQATQNFLEKGDQIAKESQDLKEELVAAVEDVRKQDAQGRVHKALNILVQLEMSLRGVDWVTFRGDF